MASTTPFDLRTTWLTYAKSLPSPSFAKDLPKYVRPDVIHNGKAIGLDGYVDAISQVLEDFPEGADQIPTVLVDEEHQMVGARVLLRPSKEAAARGVPPMMEHVFYQFLDGKIKQVWSMITPQA